MVAQRSILEVINERLNSTAFRLPNYSPMAARIQAVAQNSAADMRQIEQAVLHDPAVAGEVLKVANSAFYAGLAKISNIGQAIGRLGVDEIVNLVVMCTQGAEYRATHPLVNEWMGQLWKHAMGCALGARWLAERGGYRERAPEAFLGGLFHDVGKLLLLKVFDELSADADMARGLSQTLMEEVLVAQHAEQGARLLTHWNLPEVYVDIARNHHAEKIDECNPLAAIVRLADLACTKVGLNLHINDTLILSATPEAALLSMNDIAIAELEIKLEDVTQSLARAA